jgi:hypothetical protein
MARGRFTRTALPILLTCAALAATDCSATTTVSPTAAPAPKVAPTQPGGVQAGMQLGIAPAAAGNWAPPSKITPIDSLPGMWKSVGETPPQPGAKVRVFFLGMQW